MYSPGPVCTVCVVPLTLPPPPLVPCVSLTHPLVPSVVSITFSLRPDKAMLFWHGESFACAHR